MVRLAYRNLVNLVYAKIFKPLKVSRGQFRDIAEFRSMLMLAEGAVHAKEE